MTDGQVLIVETINPAFKRIVYQVRGPLELRARKIQAELAEVCGVEAFIKVEDIDRDALQAFL